MAIIITKRPFERSFSGNPVHYELTSAAASTDVTIFFEFRLMFKYVTEADFREVGRLSWFPTNGLAEISVHDMLHSQLEWFMPTFPVDEKTIQQADKQTGHFYIEFREITPTNQNPAWDSSEADFICTVVKGGINYFQWRGNNFWVNYFSVQKPFLTWQLSSRLAAIQERMYLAYLCSDAGMTKVVARCLLTYQDLSVATLELPQMAMSKDSVYYVPAGAIQWALDAQAATDGKVIYYWDVLLVDLTDPGNPRQLAGPFRYEADNRVNRNDMLLHYRNSLGGLDSVTIRGNVDETLDYTFQEQNQTFRPDYFNSHVITAQKTITDTLEILTYKGDIGYLGKEEQDRLRDAQIQRQVFMKVSTKWWPVNITTKTFKLKSTGDMKFSMPIEFTMAYDGADYYTPRSVDLGDGVFTDNVCLAKIADLLVTLDWDDHQTASPGFVALVISGTRYDPQNASSQFRLKILETGDTVDLLYSQLPFRMALEVNRDLTVQIQGICTGGVMGKKQVNQLNTTFNAPPPPAPMPISWQLISDTVGTTHQQLFEFTGVNVNDVLPAGVTFEMGVYSHVIMTAASNGTTDTLNSMLNQLAFLCNDTSETAWNDLGSAPPAGTPGFKPVASHSNGSNKLTLTLDNQHSFYMWVHF